MKVIIHIGLDVHNDSIAASIAPSDSTEVRRWGILGGTHEHVQRFSKQVQSVHPDATLQFCYEAGPRGFPCSSAAWATSASSCVPRACRAGPAIG